MNRDEFKDLIMCYPGAVVAPWLLTQEMTGSSPFTVMTNIFVTEFSEFGETFRKNSNVSNVSYSVNLK